MKPLIELAEKYFGARHGVELDLPARSTQRQPVRTRLDVLVTLVEAYAARHYPMDDPEPVEAIKFRIEQQGPGRETYCAKPPSPIERSFKPAESCPNIGRPKDHWSRVKAALPGSGTRSGGRKGRDGCPEARAGQRSFPTLRARSVLNGAAGYNGSSTSSGMPAWPG